MADDHSQKAEVKNGRKSGAKRSNENSLDFAKLELESRRLDGDLEFRKTELDDRRAQRAFEERRLQSDAELKRSELSQAAGYGLRFTAAQATVAAAVLALISGTAGAVIQALMTKDVEASKSGALIKIEEIKAKANIELERQKQDAAERLDRLKFETSLIAKATESVNREEQIRNLKFYLSAGFLKDEEGKISRMDVRDFPSSPQPEMRPVRELASVTALPTDDPIRESARPVGMIATRAEGSLPVGICTGWIISANYIITASHCVTFLNLADGKKIERQDLVFLLGYLSSYERGDAYRLEEVIELNERVGYAVLKVDPAAAVKYGTLPWRTREPTLGERVFVVQHPGGGVQRVSDSDCAVTAANPATVVSVDNKFIFAYRCKEPHVFDRSSGAPIFSQRDKSILGIDFAQADGVTGVGVRIGAVQEASKNIPPPAR
jgi:hypothetical protein